MIASLFTATGCSTRPTLTVASPNNKVIFKQTFTQVYCARGEDGDFDIVLLDDPIDDAAVQKPGKPLQSNPVRPLRHMVHVHVLWTPQIGDRGDHPSSTNAAINWYVWGDVTGQQTDLMHYGGAGFVKIYAGDDSADFRISNTTLKLKNSRGQMSDPMGAAQLSGSFSAPINGSRVKELLAQIDSEAGKTKLTQLDIPPARSVEP
ncbi:hypothetical protein BH10PLA1_BH10PLA1_15550 [soil metagenome]